MKPEYEISTPGSTNVTDTIASAMDHASCMDMVVIVFREDLGNGKVKYWYMHNDQCSAYAMNYMLDEAKWMLMSDDGEDD